MRRAVPSRTCRGRDASLRVASIGQRLARDAKAWSESTTRTQIRARVGCRARTHALAGGVQMGRRGFLFAALRAASSLPGSRPHFWRRTGGRRVYDRTQTVAAACNPLGETPIVSHGRKEGTVAVPTHASDVGWFPQSPPPFPPVALDRAFCRARRRRDPCNPMSLVWRCCELARDTRMYAYGIAPRGHGQALAALHRSCQVSPRLARSKGDRFQDRSNADLHACVCVCVCVCV